MDYNLYMVQEPIGLKPKIPFTTMCCCLLFRTVVALSKDP